VSTASVAPARGDRPFIEWFAEVNEWPPCRKTALFSAVALVAQLGVTVLVHFTVSRVDGVDGARLDLIALTGSMGLMVVFLVSVAAIRLGLEGRWTPHLLVIVYGLWITVFVQSLGSWSTAAFSFYPLAVVVVALYFGERVGWFSFAVGVLFLGAREIIEWTGRLDYAPVLLDRSIDAQDDPLWIGGMAIVLMSLFVFCFGIGILVVASRRIQDEKLHHAYDQLADSSSQLVRANEMIARYVPRQVIDHIMAGDHAVDFNPERRKLTIFFSDVVGFTDSSDQMDPEALAEFLNLYLTEMAEIAERHGATINQFVGDGIMSFFGAPFATDDRDHARRAVRMALEMQSTMPALNDSWIERGGRRAFEVRIGINTGYASVGDYGSPGRKTYSAIGVQTNLAARIQAQCEPGKVLVSDTTWALVKAEFRGEDRGEFTFKGLHYPVRVYEVGYLS
jgi:class 3 adenylate cyclase